MILAPILRQKRHGAQAALSLLGEGRDGWEQWFSNQ